MLAQRLYLFALTRTSARPQPLPPNNNVVVLLDYVALLHIFHSHVYFHVFVQKACLCLTAASAAI